MNFRLEFTNDREHCQAKTLLPAYYLTIFRQDCRLNSRSKKERYCFKRLSQIFRGCIAAAIPVFLQGTSPVREACRNALDDICYQVIRFLDRRLWIVHKLALDRQPAGAELVGCGVLEQRCEPFLRILGICSSLCALLLFHSPPGRLLPAGRKYPPLPRFSVCLFHRPLDFLLVMNFFF